MTKIRYRTVSKDSSFRMTTRLSTVTTARASQKTTTRLSIRNPRNTHIVRDTRLRVLMRDELIGFQNDRRWDSFCVAATASVNLGSASVYGCIDGRLIYFPSTNNLWLFAGGGGRFNLLPPSLTETISHDLRARIGARFSAGQMWHYGEGQWDRPKRIVFAMPGAYVGVKTYGVPLIDSGGPRLFGVWNPAMPRKLQRFWGVGVNSKQIGILPPGLQGHGYEVEDVGWFGDLVDRIRNSTLSQQIEEFLATTDLPLGLWMSGELMCLFRQEVSLQERDALGFAGLEQAARRPLPST